MIEADNIQTGTRGAEFHWRCSSCGFLNPGWANKCENPSCDKEYSSGHGNLLLTFKTILEASAGTGGGGPRFEKKDVNEGSIANRIVLPGGFLADYAHSA